MRVQMRIIYMILNKSNKIEKTHVSFFTVENIFYIIFPSPINIRNSYVIFYYGKHLLYNLPSSHHQKEHEQPRRYLIFLFCRVRCHDDIEDMGKISHIEQR